MPTSVFCIHTCTSNSACLQATFAPHHHTQRLAGLTLARHARRGGIARRRRATLTPASRGPLQRVGSRARRTAGRRFRRRGRPGLSCTVHGSIAASAAGGQRANRGPARRVPIGRRCCGRLVDGCGRRSPGRLRASGRRRCSGRRRSTGRRRAGWRRRAGRARRRQPARRCEGRSRGRRRRRRLDQRVAGQLARQQHAQHRELDQRLAAQRGRQRQAARQPVERWVVRLTERHASAGVKHGDGRAGWRQARWKAAECVLPGSQLLGPSPPLSSASVHMPTARHIYGTPLSRRLHPSHPTP